MSEQVGVDWKKGDDVVEVKNILKIIPPHSFA